MKTLIMIESGRTQLVLQPEGEHDKAVLKLLEKLPHNPSRRIFSMSGWMDQTTAFSGRRKKTT